MAAVVTEIQEPGQPTEATLEELLGPVPDDARDRLRLGLAEVDAAERRVWRRVRR